MPRARLGTIYAVSITIAAACASNGADPRTTSDASNDAPMDANDLGAPRTKARVLISGHSLTDNPLADHLEMIASSRGTDLRWNQQIGIGSPIRLRTKGDNPNASAWPGYRTGKNRVASKMDVPAELLDPQTIGAGERYDTLVLTERHDLLNCVQWENTVGYTRHFHDRLVAGNAAAQTYLYHSWLGLDRDQPGPWIAYEKQALYAWECVASKVNQTLDVNGKPRGVVTLPAGGALVALVERLVADTVPGITGTQRARLDAVFSDDVHLTSLGAYYLAAVTYAAVFRHSPVGATGPTGANPATVTALQQLAWDYTSAYYVRPGLDSHTMASCRAHVADHVCDGHFTLTGSPGNIAGCKSWVSNPDANNPFTDVTSYTPLPWP